MMTDKKDILEDGRLKEPAFQIDRERLDRLNSTLNDIPSMSGARRNFIPQLAPYLALAALFIAVFAGIRLLAGMTAPAEDDIAFTEEDFLLSTLPVGYSLDDAEDFLPATNCSEDEIIEYFVYSGIQVADLIEDF